MDQSERVETRERKITPRGRRDTRARLERRRCKVIRRTCADIRLISRETMAAGLPEDYEFRRSRGRRKNILCVRAGGDCKAIRHAPFVVAFYCCSRSGIVRTGWPGAERRGKRGNGEGGGGGGGGGKKTPGQQGAYRTLLQSNSALFHLRMALGFCLSSRFRPSIFSYRSKEYCSLIKRVGRRLIDSPCSAVSSRPPPIAASRRAAVRADVTWKQAAVEGTPRRAREEIEPIASPGSKLFH